MTKVTVTVVALALGAIGLYFLYHVPAVIRPGVAKVSAIDITLGDTIEKDHLDWPTDSKGDLQDVYMLAYSVNVVLRLPKDRRLSFVSKAVSLHQHNKIIDCVNLYPLEGAKRTDGIAKEVSNFFKSQALDQDSEIQKFVAQIEGKAKNETLSVQNSCGTTFDNVKLFINVKRISFDSTPDYIIQLEFCLDSRNP